MVWAKAYYHEVPSAKILNYCQLEGLVGGWGGDTRPDLSLLGGGRLKLITKMLSGLAPAGVRSTVALALVGRRGSKRPY